MNFIAFFSFLNSIFFGGIWIAIGILLRNHLDTVLSIILWKPMPDDLINPEDYQKTTNVINTIGLLFILIGIGTMIVALLAIISRI